jgi:hypothetical protein
MVAQIDEKKLAVVALAMHPARQAGGFPGIAKAQRAASMGAVFVHRDGNPFSLGVGAKTTGTAALVKETRGYRP